MILEAASGLRVVGEAATGREAIDRVGMLRPDVTLLDIQMPVMNGLEALPSFPRQSSHRADDVRE